MRRLARGAGFCGREGGGCGPGGLRSGSGAWGAAYRVRVAAWLWAPVVAVAPGTGRPAGRVGNRGLSVLASRPTVRLDCGRCSGAFGAAGRRMAAAAVLADRGRGAGGRDFFRTGHRGWPAAVTGRLATREAGGFPRVGKRVAARGSVMRVGPWSPSQGRRRGAQDAGILLRPRGALTRAGGAVRVRCRGAAAGLKAPGAPAEAARCPHASGEGCRARCQAAASP